MAVLDKNKLLPQGKKGGAITLSRPKFSLVPSKSLGSDIAKVEPAQESPTLVIKTKLIKIEDLLKGTLALEKKEADDKRKELEEEKRQKQEDQIEGAPKTKDKNKFKIPVPKKVTSFFDDIKRYIGTVLMGWLVVRLVKFLPKILPILKLLGNVADFLIKWGGIFLDGLVTLVDKGYEAFEKTSEWIGNVFGEDKQKDFEKFSKTFTKFLNVALVAAMVGAKAGMLGMGGGPKRGIVNKGKRIFNRAKRFIDPKRNQKINRAKNIKKIRTNKNNLKNKLTKSNKENARLTKINKQLKSTVNNLNKSLINAKNKIKDSVSKATNSLKNQLAKANKLNDSLKNNIKNLKTNLKNLKTNLKTAGTNLKTNLKTTGTKLKDTGGKIVKRLGMKMNKGMIQNMKGLSKMAKGVRIPIVGPLIAALFSYLADGKWDKALFVGIGTALGEMLGTAIPIPVLGTILGGLVGFYIGDLLFTLFRGGGINEVLTKLKGDLLKVLNVGKTVAKWANTGFARVIEGIPTIKVWGLGEQPNLAWLINPMNVVAKAKLIGKAFLSRDPMKEEKDKKNKKTEKNTTTKIERNKEGYLSMLSSGKKGKIEQALYEMRINSVKTGEAHSDMVGNPKYAGDVDLIMKHGMQKVEIDRGRVKLHGNAENIIPLDVNSVSKKATSVSTEASYEETGGETVIIKSGSEDTEVDVNNTDVESSTTLLVTAGGGGDDLTEALYEGG